MGEESGRLGTLPACWCQGVSGAAQRVLVIARILLSEALSRRWKRLEKVGAREIRLFAEAR